MPISLDNGPVPDDNLDRFKGALLGCAVGDALGAPLEGMARERIKAEYGKVVDFLDLRFGLGRITDDTQMTVALAQSIVETGKFDLEHTAEKFGSWMKLSDTGVKQARGAGAACQDACRKLYQGVSPSRSGVDSAGCGSAMRVSPVGLRFHHDLELVKQVAIQQSGLTHTDSRAHAGAVLVALAVALGVENREEFVPISFLEGLAQSVDDVSRSMAQKVRGLVGYLKSDIGAGLAYTGVGGYVLETVPAALLVFLHSPFEFEETVVEAVNCGGDTDSIGAIAGAISGSFNGAGSIPARFLDRVEGRPYLELIAHRLFTLSR